MKVKNIKEYTLNEIEIKTAILVYLYKEHGINIIHLNDVELDGSVDIDGIVSNINATAKNFKTEDI